MEPVKGTKPVAVFFQQAKDGTTLPIDKLKKWQSTISLFQRSSTSDEPRPLHGKLLVIEGAEGPHRKPYLLVLHGSPNFTQAAYLTRPPKGNAEIAILTTLPPRQNGTGLVWESLGLKGLFGEEMVDWSTLHYRETKKQPRTAEGKTHIGEVMLRVADRKLVIHFDTKPEQNTTVRVHAEIDGVWTEIAASPCGIEQDLELDGTGLVRRNDKGILSLLTGQVRFQFENPAGEVLSKMSVPVNVDCPQHFCGLVMTGPLITSLDQRIALAGCGLTKSYREQQKYISQYESRDTDGGKMPQTLTHQADLDRFFRNISTGLRGIRTRFMENRSSEFAFRRTVKDLTGWLQEAMSEGNDVQNRECMLYLVDRLVRELESMLIPDKNAPGIRQMVAVVNREYNVAAILQSVRQWLDGHQDNADKPYIAGIKRHLRAISVALPQTENI
jgi:hypothetical protein